MTAPKVASAPAVPRQAPATPSQSPFVIRARELEKQLENEVERKGKEKSARRHAIEAQLADLQHIEGLRHSGANPRAPMGELQRRAIVNASEQNPDMYIRFIDESKEGRVDYVQQLGYVKISDTAGGKQLGKSALYGIPRERRGELEASKRMRTASQLRSHKTEVQQEVEKAIEELNEQGYGPFNARDHIISEE